MSLPVTHVDSIQFQSGWRRTPEEECDRKLNAIASKERWIIDGFGSDKVIEKRIEDADTILFVDFPIWRHYWWAFKRQLTARRGQRKELPENCPEFTFTYTRKLIQIMWLVHKEYTPWFRKLVSAKSETGNVLVLRKPSEIVRLIRDVERAPLPRPNQGVQSDKMDATRPFSR